MSDKDRKDDWLETDRFICYLNKVVNDPTTGHLEMLKWAIRKNYVPSQQNNESARASEKCAWYEPSKVRYGTPICHNLQNRLGVCVGEGVCGDKYSEQKDNGEKEASEEYHKNLDAEIDDLWDEITNYAIRQEVGYERLGAKVSDLYKKIEEMKAHYKKDQDRLHNELADIHKRLRNIESHIARF